VHVGAAAPAADVPEQFADAVHEPPGSHDDAAHDTCRTVHVRETHHGEADTAAE